MIGQVKTWYMTEEQRLAYIAEHPIVPTDKPNGSTFESVYTINMNQNKEQKKRPSIMDKVDKEDLHRRFLAGEKLKNMANHFDVTIQTLDKYIRKQREIDPDKWPYRTNRKGLKFHEKK